MWFTSASLSSCTYLEGSILNTNRQITLRIVGYHFSSKLTATLIPDWFAKPLEHMPKKFEINRTKIKGSCQSGKKVVSHDSKSALPLVVYKIKWFWMGPICKIHCKCTDGLLFCDLQSILVYSEFFVLELEFFKLLPHS